MKPFAVLALCLSSSTLWAACERADVEFYLQKGFSPEQITRLCATAAAPSPVVSGQPAAVAAQPVAPQAEPENTAQLLEALATALKVEALRIEGDKLLFRHKLKVKYGEEDVFGNLPEVKPWVQVSISLPSLRLIKAAKRIPVLRGAYVLISGDIAQTVVEPEQYKASQLQGIQAYIDEEIGLNTVKIKVQPDASINRVAADLQELGLRYRRR